MGEVRCGERGLACGWTAKTEATEAVAESCCCLGTGNRPTGEMGVETRLEEQREGEVTRFLKAAARRAWR